MMMKQNLVFRTFLHNNNNSKKKKLKINIHRHRGSKKGSTPLKNKFKLNKNFLVMQIANKSLPIKSSTFAWCQKNKLIEKFS
jgi:hypothetical protein